MAHIPESYGPLKHIIIKCNDIINSNPKSRISTLIKKCLKETVNTDYNLIEDIIYRIKKDGFEKMNINFRDYDNHFHINEVENKKIKVPKKYKPIEKQFQILFNTPQPEQRTQEWFDYRYNRITASDMGAAIDCNPYEGVEGFIWKKCDPNFPFLDNDYVFHGKKYEQIATQLYEHIYNNKVTEFGCVPSDKYEFLGASPDGICSKSTLDGKFSPMVGTMLEIKCPFVRKIKTKGKIAGEICPFYYYCQVQQQLECCDLNDCDFWQCELTQYENEDEYYADEKGYTTRFSEGVDDKVIEIDPKWTRGMVIQFKPKNWEEWEPAHKVDKLEFKSTWLYPPRLDMSDAEYRRWIKNSLDSLEVKHPEIYENYIFDRILYWKISKSHNVKIYRDKEWFQHIYPVLVDTWDKVLKARDDPKLAKHYKDIGDKRRKFYKMNTKLNINNYTRKDFLFGKLGSSSEEDINFDDSD
jgi:putative phage-type endonuclease